MLLKSYIVIGSLICLSFAVGAARGWKAPHLGFFNSSGSSSSSGGGGVFFGGRWSSGSGGWGGGK